MIQLLKARTHLENSPSFGRLVHSLKLLTAHLTFEYKKENEKGF